MYLHSSSRCHDHQAANSWRRQHLRPWTNSPLSSLTPYKCSTRFARHLCCWTYRWDLFRRGSEWEVSDEPSDSGTHIFRRYDDKVERYLDVFLRTPGTKPADVTKAQLARGNARRLAAERLLAKAHQGTLLSYYVLLCGNSCLCRFSGCGEN